MSLSFVHVNACNIVYWMLFTNEGVQRTIVCVYSRKETLTKGYKQPLLAEVNRRCPIFFTNFLYSHSSHTNRQCVIHTNAHLWLYVNHTIVRLCWCLTTVMTITEMMSMGIVFNKRFSKYLEKKK